MEANNTKNNLEDNNIYDFKGRSRQKKFFYEQGTNLFHVIFLIWPTAILQFCEFWSIGFIPSVMAYNYTALALMFGFYSLACSHYDQKIFIFLELIFSIISFIQYGFFVNEWNTRTPGCSTCTNNNNLFFNGITYYSMLSGVAPGYTVKINTTTVSYSTNQGSLLSWWNFQLGWVSVLQLIAFIHFIIACIVLSNDSNHEKPLVKMQKSSMIKPDDDNNSNYYKSSKKYEEEEEEEEIIIITENNEGGREEKLLDEALNMRYIRPNDFVEYSLNVGGQYALRVGITSIGVITMFFCVVLLCLSFVLIIQNISPFYQLVYSANFLLWYIGTVCILLPQGNRNYSCFTSGKYKKSIPSVKEIRKKLIQASSQKDLSARWSNTDHDNFFKNVPRCPELIIAACYEMPPIINPGLRSKTECDTLIFGRKSPMKRIVMMLYMITVYVAFLFSIWISISQVIWSNEQSSNTVAWLCTNSFKTTIQTNGTYTYNTNYTVQLLPTNGTAIIDPTLYWYTIWGCTDLIFNWFSVLLSFVFVIIVTLYGYIFLSGENLFFTTLKKKKYEEGRMKDCYELYLIDGLRQKVPQYHDLGLCRSVIDEFNTLT